MKKCYLAVDPGATAGIAVVDDDRTLRVSLSVTGQCPTDVIRYVRQRAGLPIVSAAIESQYVSVNMATTLTLAVCAGRWVEACESNGIPVDMINPSEWQADMLNLANKASRKERKHAAIDMCRRLWHVDLDEHAADAALMALHHLCNGDQRCWSYNHPV